METGIITKGSGLLLCVGSIRWPILERAVRTGQRLLWRGRRGGARARRQDRRASKRRRRQALFGFRDVSDPQLLTMHPLIGSSRSKLAFWGPGETSRIDEATPHAEHARAARRVPPPRR